MKIMYLVVALVAATITQSSAQNTTAQPASLLNVYFSIKDALVSGNAALATSKAQEFSTILKSPAAKNLNEASKTALLKDATQLTAGKTIKIQRDAFSAFSDDMIALAKKEKLSAEPVYLQYCPMKNSSWLSNAKAVKNPYYGAAMLSCGKVTGTL